MLREAGGGRGGGGFGGGVGVSGLKALGVKDLTYKTAFLACMATSADARVRFFSSAPSCWRICPLTVTPSLFQSNATNIRSDTETGNEDTREDFLQSLTKEEIEHLKEMVNTEHIYAKLVSSIAPTVYGESIPIFASKARH